MEKVSFKYKLYAPDVLECFKVAGKKSGKKTALRALIFLLLCGCFLYEYIKNSESTLSFVLASVCFAFCLLVWYLPVRNRKSLALDIEAADNEYYMEFSDEQIYFNEEKTDSAPAKSGECYYETDRLFILDMGKDRVFCVNKEERTPEENDFIREYLKSGVYEDKRKKPMEEKING